RHRRTHRRLLVAVARTGPAGGIERLLHQPGAIEPETLPSAPEVGRADKPFCHGDEVRCRLINRSEMLLDEPAAGGFQETAVAPLDANEGVHGVEADRRGPDAWSAVAVGAERPNHM